MAGYFDGNLYDAPKDEQKRYWLKQAYKLREDGCRMLREATNYEKLAAKLEEEI